MPTAASSASLEDLLVAHPAVGATGVLKRVLARCEALQRTGVWSPNDHLRPRGWLENFKTDSEKLVAAAILDRFVYYSEDSVDALLLGSFRRLAEVRCHPTVRPGDNRATLEKWFDQLVFTPVEGEDPNRSDSGNLLCRKARQVIGVPGEQILDPSDAVARASFGSPIIFLDDFVGTGQQLKKTWERRHDSIGSFAEMHKAKRFPAYCLSLLATEAAIANSQALGVSLVCCHLLTAQYSFRAIERIPGLPTAASTAVTQPLIEAFLHHHAPNLILEEIPQKYAAFGFGDLGLLLAFEHSTPDSTLPIIWARSKAANWVPLAERL